MFLQSDVLLIVPGIFLAMEYGQCLTAVTDRYMGVMESFQYSPSITASNRTCAELAPRHRSARELDLKLVPPADFRRLLLPSSVGFPAARAFKSYRAACGQRTPPLPDFFIGARAGAEVVVLLTRDATRYRTYLPKVRLICP